MRLARPVAVALLLAALSPAARAEREPLPVKPAVDLTVTLAAGGLWFGTELAKPRFAPAACRVCEPTALDEAARGAVLWDEPLRARRVSDALAFGLVPLGVATHALWAARAGGDSWSEGFGDLLLIFEGAAVAGALGQAVKFSVGRERPFVHHRNGLAPDRAPEADDNLSFYSGHASFTFALAVGAGTVAHLRGDPSAPWVLGGGLALASTVAWLRMAGDMHWLTDVLAGAAAGSLVGWGLPTLVHRARVGGAGSPQARLAPALPAFGFTVAF